MQPLTDPLVTEPKERWQWQWQSNPNPWDKKEEPQWTSYSLKDNYLIEKAYYDQQKEVDIGEYIVSVKHMLQKKKGDVFSQRPIRRIEDDILEMDRSQRYFETELPKTINIIFGNLGDYIRFFSRRNPEILDFTNEFKELEKSNDLGILNQKIIPKLIDCFQEALLKPNLEKLKDPSLLKFRKKLLENANERITELISLFKKDFLSFEEFYGQVLRAYTMNTGLYSNLNNSLRNESWVEVDKLLPYAFCLSKAFFSSRMKASLSQNHQAPSSQFFYRGTAFDKSALNRYDEKIIKYFCWNSVTSTTTSKEIAEEFMLKSADLKNKKYPVIFIIEIPLEDHLESEYAKWIDIRQFSAIPREDEMILAPGSAFELVDVITDKNMVTTIKIKLRNEIQSLALRGVMMQGALQSQLMTEKEAKIMCLDGEDLGQALTSLCGNKLIEELEFGLCTFDAKLLNKMYEILPTLEKAKDLKFRACIYEGSKEIAIERPKEGQRCGITKIQVIEGNGFFQMICNKRWDQKYWVYLRELDLDFRGRRDLKDEELDCVVSRRLEYLPKLTHLNVNLEYCRGITDKGVNSLAKGLNYLIQLRHLNISLYECNQITDQEVDSLAKRLNSLTQLTYLDLNLRWCTRITDKGVNILAKLLNSLTQLTHLDLRFRQCNGITDKGVNSFGQELNSLRQLTHLNLHFELCELITDKGIEVLASQGLKCLTQLTSLSLDFTEGNSITNKGLSCLWFQGLKYLHQLRSLNLVFGWTAYAYKYAYVFARSLQPQELVFLEKLTSLTLYGLQYDDKALDTFASDGLKHLTQLTSLTLYFSPGKFDQMTDEGVEKLACQGLKYLTSLTSLDLGFFHFPQITDGGLKKLACQGLRFLTSLKALKLTFYKFDLITSGGVESLMSEGLRNLTRLTSLVLDCFLCNQITDKSIEILASQCLKDLIIFKSLTVENQILQTINIKTQEALKDSRIKLVRENTEKEKQSEYEEFLALFSQKPNLKLTPKSPEWLKRPEGVLTQKVLRIMVPTLKKDEEGTHNLHSTLRTLQIPSEIRSLMSLTLDFKIYNHIITNEFVHKFGFQVLGQLVHLKSLTLIFSECNKITNEGVRNLAVYGLKPLTELASLDINFRNCDQISDKGVLNLAWNGLRHVSQLKSLSLGFYDCQEITDVGLRHLAFQGLKNLSQLKSFNLDFSRCEQISDEGMITLAAYGLESLSQLQSIALRLSKKITDVGIEGLVSQGLNNLARLKCLTLDLTSSEIRDKGVNNLILRVVKDLPQLNFLDLSFRGCENISNFTIHNLIKIFYYFGFTKRITDFQEVFICQESLEGFDYMSD